MSARVRSSKLGEDNNRSVLPVSGKIRPGIKVPSAKAKAVPAAITAYREGLAVNATFDEITIAMKAADKNCPAYPLIPKNSPYFRVHPSDFRTPGSAEKIMELYATKRPGDTVPHLYSFPVLFPSDDIDLFFTEEFKQWKRSELVHWSDNDQCMQLEKIKPDKNRRGKRWGGRARESIGPCDPNDCEWFASGECKHHGALYFWVPEMEGIGIVELKFTSVNAADDIMRVLKFVQTSLGHVGGVHHGKEIFWVSKLVQNISVLDNETGKTKRQNQELICLEARNIDMLKVLIEQESARVSVPKVVPETKALPKPAKDEWPLPEPDLNQLKPEPEPELKPEPEPELKPELKPEPEPEPEPEIERPPLEHEPEQNPGTIKKLRKQISEVLPKIQWSTNDLKEWVAANYGGVRVMRDEKVLIDIYDKLSSLIKETPVDDDEPPF